MYFVNWQAYMRVQKPLLPSLRFTAQSFYTVMQRAFNRLQMARGGDNKSSMTIDGCKDLNIKITPRGFIETCLQENKRRMSGYDQRLFRLQFVPRLVRVACPLLGKAS
jgi:hypothetical protein